MSASSAKPAPAAGSRLEPDARRAHLLEVGSVAFGDHPYEDVQIDQIAQRAGVSRGLLYHYFSNKRDFFAEIVRNGCGEILSRTAPALLLPAPERLRASLDAYLDFVEQNPHVYRAIFRSAASVDTRIRKIVSDNLDQQTQRLMDGLGFSQPKNELLRIAIRAWLAFLIHAVLDWIDEESVITREALLSLSEKTLEAAMHAAVAQR